MSANTDQHPWYRHPWVWLLIALPLSAVIGGIITIYLAVTTSDGLVVDDYYRHGKAINRVLARDRAAAEHGLEARITLDVANNEVTVQLRSLDMVLPEALTLAFLHPTTKGHDQQVRLTRTGADRYSGRFDDLRRGDWYVQLAADDWRLSGRIRIPLESPAVLLPHDSPGR
ncbi:MAG: FixH family protein [Gammaproteobacteria bacterium]|nr:MAG: FixH family protein [Gammaproteobacteria bacterium]